MFSFGQLTFAAFLERGDSRRIKQSKNEYTYKHVVKHNGKKNLSQLFV